MLVGNPTDHRPERGGERQGLPSKKIFWILAVVAIVGWLYIILQSELFEVQVVQVEGAKMNDPLDIERSVYDILDHRTNWRPWQTRQNWFIDPVSLAAQIQERLYVQQVEVKKEGSHILRLIMKEYPHKVILTFNQSFYWIDFRGHIDSELSKEERVGALQRIYGKQPSVVDDAPIVQVAPLVITTTTPAIMTSERVKALIGFTIRLDRLNLPFRVLELQTPTSSRFTLVNNEGKPVYFDLDAPEGVERQIDTYKAFIEAQKTKKEPTLYQYVDVRVPGLIFLK